MSASTRCGQVERLIADEASTQLGSGDRFYVAELDSLRFFAFAVVFCHHAPPQIQGFWRAQGLAGILGMTGAFGVDLFFALSAYLITTLLLREKAAIRHIDIKAFYVRRGLRIWPLYFFYLALAFCLSRIQQTTGVRPVWFFSMEVPTIYFLLLSTFAGNYAFALFSDPALIVGALWSLSIEEQFYLVWPQLLRKLSRPGVLRAALAMLVIASSRRLLDLVHILHVNVWYDSLARLDSIAVGILLALLPMNWLTGLRALPRAGLVLAGLASWIFAAWYCDLPSFGDTTVRTMLGYPAIALGSAAFLSAALGAGRAGWRFMLSPRLIYLGRISYGLYVYQMLALMVARLFVVRFVGAWLMRAHWPAWLAWPIYLAMSFTSTVILAAISYRWLEAPFLRFKRRFTHVASRPV